MTLGRVLALVLAAGCALAATPAAAQSFPTRPITIVVPYPAGGPTDTIARLLGERMRASLGQTIVIENVAGAGGNIGVGRVARAPGDGYTLSIGHWGSHVVNGAIYSLPYDLLTDLEPVALVVGRTATDRRGEIRSGQGHQGTDRLAEGQSRQGHGGHDRRRRRRASRRRLVPERHRHQHPDRAVSRRGAAHAGPALRPDSPGVRPGGERAAAGAQRQPAGLRGHVEDAARGRAGHSDRRRGRPAGVLHLGLARAVGVQGHAEGRRSASSTPPWSTRSRIRTCAPAAGRTRAGASGRASSRRPRRSPPTRRPRSRSGGRSSRPPASRWIERASQSGKLVLPSPVGRVMRCGSRRELQLHRIFDCQTANAPPPVLLAAPGTPSSNSPSALFRISSKPDMRAEGSGAPEGASNSALMRRGARRGRARTPPGAPPRRWLSSPAR